MAGVDSLLRMLAQYGADELRLGTDEAPRMLQRGAPVRLSIPPTSDEMLRHLVAPLLTDEHEAQLRDAGKAETSYAFEGREQFAVAFARRGAGGFNVVFRRTGAAPATKAATPSPPANAPPPPPTPASPPSLEVVRPPAPMHPAPMQPAPMHPAPESALSALLERAVSFGASDLHLCTGEPPSLRIDGRLRLATELPAVSVEELFAGPLADVGDVLASGRSADIALDVPTIGRFRVNLYRAGERLAAAVRVLMRAAPSLHDLHFPVAFDDVIDAAHGLVIVTGPTGSGKSATLSALAAEAVRRRGALLISLEDPVEYVIGAAPPALVRQRQIGRDVRDFPTGLRDALREDPDILLIGEMRDPETISLALTAAETGHLVLTSLHSRSAASSVERIVDSYPAERQQQIRVQLADALRAVVAQRLVLRARGEGRLPALEILRGTHSVASLIRDGKTAQLSTVLQSSRKEGMLPLERCLADLVRSGQIARESAVAVANDPSSLQSYLSS
jgi:twitching motility protein PilT